MTKFRPGLAVLGILPAMVMADAAAAQDKHTLVFNRWLPENHFFMRGVLTPWAERVAEVTRGEVTVTFTTSSLAPPPRQYDLVEAGAVDLGFAYFGYTTDRFPVSSLLSEPLTAGPTAEATSVAWCEAYSGLQDRTGEFRGMKLVGMVAAPTGPIFTKTEVKQVDDYRGMKLRSGDAVLTRAYELLGAVPVFGPAPQSYEMLSTGVIDGTAFNYTSTTSFNTEEFLRYNVEVPGGIINGAFYIVMNEDSWNRLSDSQKAAFDSVSGCDFAKRAGRFLDEDEKREREKALAAGVTETEASPEFLAEVQRRLGSMLEDSIRTASVNGIDARALYDRFQAAARDYKAAD